MQNGVGEVGPPELWVALACLLAQGEGHVSGAAAKIENAGIGLGEGLRESAGGATPPQAVDVEGEHMVEQVVARSDRGKHLADGAGGGIGIARAFGGGSEYGFVGSGHFHSCWLMMF